MNKKHFFTSVLGAAALATPLMSMVLSNNASDSSARQVVHHDSIWNPATTLDQNAALGNQDVQDALAKQKNYGNYTAWTTQTMLGGSTINALAPDGHGGFVVGGDDGKFDRIDASGDLEASWATKTLLGGKTINVITPVADGFLVAGEDGAFDYVDSKGVSKLANVKTVLGKKDVNVIIPDGQGSFFVGGANGALDHLDSQGDVLANWTTKTLLHGSTIKTIVPDGSGGFLVGGQNGNLDHIDAQGNLVANWTTVTLLGGADINAIATDDQGNFFVAGQGGKLDKVDATGATVANWKTKDLFNNDDITTLFADGNNGFFATSAKGELTHLDANGDVIGGWSDYALLGGKQVKAFTFDGVGGFFVGGEEGKLDHIDANGLSLKFNSWVISHDQEEAEYVVYKDMLTKDWSISPSINFITNDGSNPVTPVGNGNFYVIDDKNILHLIQSDGKPVPGFNPIPLFSNTTIANMTTFTNAVSDGDGGFVAVARQATRGNSGKILLVHVDSNGTYTDWTNKVPDQINYGFRIVQDGNGGYWVAGSHLSHLDAQGKLLEIKPNVTDGPSLPHGSVFIGLTDGQGGVFIAGYSGQFGHIDANGDATFKTLSSTLVANNTINDIYSLAHDGQGGLFVGDNKGLFNHIDNKGELINGWTTKKLLLGNSILAIAPDGNGGFFVGGTSGKLDHVDYQGNLITGWTTKTFFGGSIDIIDITPDGQGGFLVWGQNGQLDHIDADGNSTKPETKEETLARWRNHAEITETNDALDVSDFTFTNNAGQISVNYKDKGSLPTDLGLVYSTDNGQTWAPSVDNLHNGNTFLVHEKFIDDTKAAYYQLKNDATVSLTTIAPKVDLNDSLSAADFKIVGLRSGATVTFNKPSLSPLLGVEYSADGGTNWSPTIPVSLHQNDTIKARLVPNDPAATNDLNIVNTTPIDLNIDVPLKDLNDQIAQSDFTFSTQADGHINVNFKKQLSSEVKVVYSTDGINWADNVPTNLKYGDKLMAKFDFINVADKDDYNLANPNQVELKVVKTQEATKLPVWGWALVGVSGAFIFVGLALLFKKFLTSPRKENIV